MAWIKRNLFFLIGSLVALALMIGGAIYLYQQISDEGTVAAKIAEQYAELKRLYDQNPHPGDERINNIQAAKEQELALKAYTAKIQPLFQRIPSIPDSGSNKVSNADFATQLRNTVDKLRHTASQQSVLLPQNYYFTFESQKNLMVFDPASLNSMAAHLGEIKAICDIFFDAKVNSLDGIRREKISEINDNSPSDYLPQRTMVTPLAELTPYEVTFKCFSTELALVLAHLAGSSNAFLVKTINVEPAASTTEEQEVSTPVYTPAYPLPYNPMQQQYEQRGRRGAPYPGFAPPPTVAPVPGPVRNSVFLNEKPFRVTLSIIVVKLKPVK